MGSLDGHSGRSASPPAFGVVVALANEQWGVVTREQLRDLGATTSAVEHWVRRGRLTSVHVGVYAVGHSQLRIEGRWLAAVLAAGEGAVLSHHDAAALWGLRTRAASVVHVSAKRSRHHHPGIRVHRPRTLRAEDVARVSGVPVTALARTLLDLAGVLPAGELESAVARALRHPDYDAAHMLDVLARGRGHRGVRRLAALTAAEPRITRSRLERRFLALVRRHGLPEPETNVRMTFGAGEEWELDVLWRAQRVSVELDGWQHHRDRLSFERDRERLVTLTAAGHTHLQVTWRQLNDRPEQVLAALRRALS